MAKSKLRQRNKWELEGVEDLEHNLRLLERESRKRIVIDGLFKGSDVTLSRVKQLVPKGDSRKLLKSIDRKKLKASVRIFSSKFYAPWVEYGTDPHEIKPKSRSALTVGDSGLYARASHPGARPKPFMRPAMDETRRRVVEIMSRSIRDDISQLRFKGTR